MGHIGETGRVFPLSAYVSKIPAYDPVAATHYWVMILNYKCDPVTLINGERFNMNLDNLVNIAGPGCCYCGNSYSEELAKQRCVYLL